MSGQPNVLYGQVIDNIFQEVLHTKEDDVADGLPVELLGELYCFSRSRLAKHQPIITQLMNEVVMPTMDCLALFSQTGARRYSQAAKNFYALYLGITALNEDSAAAN